MPMIEPGQPAPPFNLTDQHGARHVLNDYRGRAVVLYFYPKDDTPGCTTEACAFRDLLPKFSDANAAILGVSPDDQHSHDAFARKFNLNFTLLADPKGTDGTPPTCTRYGVWQEKNVYGKPVMGVVRTTYLIDNKGLVARRWDKVNVEGHAQEVLAAIDELAGRD